MIANPKLIEYQARAQRVLLAFLLPLVGGSVVLAAPIQTTDNMEKDHWGSRHGSTSDGQLLWLHDVNNEPLDVYYYDGLTTTLVQTDANDAVDEDSAFGLGSGSVPGEVIGAWRRGTDFAWIWVNDGTPPVEIDTKLANAFDPDEFSNPEALAIADGCAFMAFQAFDANNDGSKHVYRIDPSSGQPIALTGGMVNGAERIHASGCQAIWVFQPDRDDDDGTLEVQFFDGTCIGETDESSCVSVVDSIPLNRLYRADLVKRDFDITDGRLVYQKDVGANRQIFLYDSTTASPAPTNLSDDPARHSFNPQTDGHHVAWLEENCDGSVDIYLNGGVKVTDATTRPADSNAEYPFVLQQGQMIWKDAAGNLRYLAGNQIGIVDVAPAETVNNPWLADGIIAWHGDDGGNDDEIFLTTGSSPDDDSGPPPPMRVLARPRNGRVVVEWDRVIGATAFNLYYAEESGVTKDNYLSLAGGSKIAEVSSPFSVEGLTNGSTYYFAVTTVGAGTESPSTGEAAATLTVFTVDVTSDSTDANAGDGVCADAQGDCTLRAAIQEASYLDIGATVVVPAGTYTLTLAGTNEDQGATGDLDITGSMILEGAGAQITVIDGNAADRVLDVDPAGLDLEVEIKGVMIRNGANTSGLGAGVRNGARLLITESAVSNNLTNSNGGGIANDGDLILDHVTVSDNVSLDQAGGIDNHGCIKMVDSILSDNTANSHGGNLRNHGGRSATLIRTVVIGGHSMVGGGGIYAGGEVSIIDCEIRGNSSVGGSNWGGGGVLNESGTIYVTGTTISDNTSPTEGGGIHNEGGTVFVSNSTISGNTAGTNGGGVHTISFNTNNPADVVLHNTTLANNSAVVGGAVYNSNSYNTVSLRHVTLADSVGSDNCGGFVVSSLGYNLDSDNSCGLVDPTDLVNVDPLLGPLADNGGLTPTHALMAGSPAIDAGDPAGCNDPDGALMSHDQRGGQRPHDGDGDQTAVCDIGAFEQHGACDDADGDGYGSTGNPVCPSGSLPDCDNSNADVYPGAPQICDGLNNDCVHASWPALAGTNEADDDADGASECQGDCNDADPELWGPPSEVRNLIVLADGQTLSWSAPLDYGGTAVSIVYDTLRSQDPASFDGAVCVETDDGSDTEALDATTPDSGFVNHYLVRAENVCSAGTLGAASGGEERTGGSCP